MSFAAGFAAGLAVAKKKFGGGGGDKPEHDWDYQKWLDLPEPNDNQAVFLIRITDASITFDISVGSLLTTGSINDAFSIDWGDDSSVQTFSSDAKKAEHSYSDTGEYVVTFTDILGYNNSVYMLQNYAGYSVMAKYGNDVLLLGNCYNCSNLRYIKLSALTEFNANYFRNCRALNRIEFDGTISNLYSYMFQQCYNLNFDNINFDFENITDIPEYCFGNCLALENMTFSSCASIGRYAFNGCFNLKSVSFPSCSSIDYCAFNYCFKLNSFKAASGCTYGNNCFVGCYGLYPKPDGSIN